MWYPGKAAFRAGEEEVNGSAWSDANIGQRSVALGYSTAAKGESSLALNTRTQANGNNSIAGGDGSIADGLNAVALGTRTVASGNQAAALGFRTVASGENSFALGADTKATGRGSMATGLGTAASGAASMATGAATVAAGSGSVALGTGVTAQGDGSFAFGDRNTQYAPPVGENGFWVRAFGGVALNTGVNIGCDLPPNTGAWACSSSKLLKEGFEDVDGEEILARLKDVPIQRWRYIGTAARHLGPFAEDFHAAFGLGEDADKIAQIDADGVALSAVQALERRTAELRMENAELRRRLEALERAAHHSTGR
jgi:hypothetical protein